MGGCHFNTRYVCASRPLSSSPEERVIRRGAHADWHGWEPLHSWSRGEPIVHSWASDPGWPEAAVRPLLPALRTRYHSQDHAAGAGLAQKPKSGSSCRDRQGSIYIYMQTQIIFLHVVLLQLFSVFFRQQSGAQEPSSSITCVRQWCRCSTACQMPRTAASCTICTTTSVTSRVGSVWLEPTWKH